ncbi:hypothetical protein ACWERW_35370 [Streptomyces sp. NPDC004012]
MFGRRSLTPSKDEHRLLARLKPSHWREHREARGLDDTQTARPRLTDAGITAAVRLNGTWTDAKLRAAKDAVPAFGSVARMGRAAEIHLVWCTQKPTMSGPSAGIPPQIAGHMDERAALCLSSPTEARTVLGEDATAGGWDAHTLPRPGALLLRGTGRGPAPVWRRSTRRRPSSRPPRRVSLPRSPMAPTRCRASSRLRACLGRQ